MAENFVRDLEDSTYIDLTDFINAAQEEFDYNLGIQEKHIQNIGISACFDKLSTDWLEQWRKTASEISQRQESSFRRFITELIKVEDDFENSGQKVIRHWSALLHECGVQAKGPLDKRIKEEWVKVKRRSDVQSVRRAAILLPSEASRNFDILMLVADFLLCLISIKNEGQAIIDAIEGDNESRLTELKNIGKYTFHK